MRQTRDLACPDCQRPLERRRAGSLSAHVCVSCAGLFLPSGMLEAAREDPAVRARVREPEVEPQAEPPDRAPVANDRRCPQCRAPMETRKRGGHPPLRIEVCRRDGVFLDRGELTLLVERLEHDKAFAAGMVRPGGPGAGASGAAATPLAAAATLTTAATLSAPQGSERSLGDAVSVAGDVVEGVLEVGGTVLDIGEVIAAIFA